MVGAFVFALMMLGMTEASMTLRPSTTVDAQGLAHDARRIIAAAHPASTDGMPIRAHGGADVVGNCRIILDGGTGQQFALQLLTQGAPSLRARAAIRMPSTRFFRSLPSAR